MVSLRSTTDTPLQGPECFNLQKPTLEEFDRESGRTSDFPRTSPHSTAPVAGLRHKATPDGVHVDVVDHRHQGPGFPDVRSSRHLIARTGFTGWLGQNAPGVRRWPLTCRRLTCGVLRSTTDTPLQGPECFNLQKPTLEEFDRESGRTSDFPRTSPHSTTRQSLAFATRPRRTGFMWM